MQLSDRVPNFILQSQRCQAFPLTSKINCELFQGENNYLNSDLSGVGLDYMRPLLVCPHVFNSPRQPKTAKTANVVSKRGILIFRPSHTDSLLHQPKVLPRNPSLLLFIRQLTTTTKNGGEGAKKRVKISKNHRPLIGQEYPAQRHNSPASTAEQARPKKE